MLLVAREQRARASRLVVVDARTKTRSSPLLHRCSSGRATAGRSLQCDHLLSVSDPKQNTATLPCFPERSLPLRVLVLCPSQTLCSCAEAVKSINVLTCPRQTQFGTTQFATLTPSLGV